MADGTIVSYNDFPASGNGGEVLAHKEMTAKYMIHWKLVPSKVEVVFRVVSMGKVANTGFGNWDPSRGGRPPP